MNETELPMTPRQRIRRTAFICIHTLTNAACYRAGTDSLPVMGKHHFWLRAHNNFAEMAVLQWCKVFADKNAKHYCLRVITKPEGFTTELLAHLKLNPEEFNAYVLLMRNLRDKFIAHLDDDLTAAMPKLDPAIASASFLLT